jgi:HEAT repeat protein
MYFRLTGSALLLLALAGLSEAQSRGKGRRPTKPAEVPAARAYTSDLATSPKEVGGKSLSEWEKELIHSDPSRRSAALVAIPRFGEASAHAVPAVLKRCNDADASPRVKAVIALRYMQVNPADVPEVIKALTKRVHPYYESQTVVKYEAVVTLLRFARDAQYAISSLRSAAVDKSSWEIRQGALAVMWRAALAMKPGPDKAKQLAYVYSSLIGGVRDPAQQVRLEAIQGLGGLGRPGDAAQAKQVINALNAVLDGKNYVLAIWAYAGLVNMYGDANTKEGDQQIKFIAKFLDKKKHKIDTRVHAAMALGALGARSKVVQADLLALLKDDTPVMIHAACGTLVSMGKPDAKVINGFLGLLSHKDPNVVYSGCLALVMVKANQKAVLAALDKHMGRKGIDPNLKQLYKDTIDELKKGKEDLKRPKE